MVFKFFFYNVDQRQNHLLTMSWKCRKKNVTIQPSISKNKKGASAAPPLKFMVVSIIKNGLFLRWVWELQSMQRYKLKVHRP